MSYAAISLGTALTLGWLLASVLGTWAYMASESPSRR